MQNLRCSNICKSFDGVRALINLDLDFSFSGITSIIGPNGAGKTTLINILTGFLKPDSGKCSLGEREITKLSPDKICRLGISRTFQDLRLIRQSHALENVLLATPHQRGETLIGALLRIGVSKEEAQNRLEALGLLELVGIEGKAHQPANELSYGQQKLLTLACCLATRAHILLLDEPVAGVHPNIVRKILDLLRRLRDDGKKIVLIEHDISAVREISDDVIVLDHGKLKAQGPPREVLEKPEIMEAYLA